MRDDHKRCPTCLLKAAENRVNLVAGSRIKLAGRLVGEDQNRPLHEGTGDRHSLLLTSGKLVRPMLEPLAQANLRQQLDSPLREARA